MLTLFLDWRVQLSHRRGAGTALCALAVATGLVLTGCGADPEPVPTTTPTSTETAPSTPEPSQSADTPEPTAEPTTAEPVPEPTPPDPAELINENTEEGAKSAVKYFLDLRQFTFDVRDDTEWMARSTEDCQYCPVVSEAVNQMVAADHHRVGGQIVVDAFIAADQRWPNHWVVEFLGTESPITLFDSLREVVFEDFGGNAEFAMFVKLVDGHWKLDEIAN